MGQDNLTPEQLAVLEKMCPELLKLMANTGLAEAWDKSLSPSKIIATGILRAIARRFLDMTRKLEEIYKLHENWRIMSCEPNCNEISYLRDIANKITKIKES